MLQANPRHIWREELRLLSIRKKMRDSKDNSLIAMEELLTDAELLRLEELITGA